MTIHIRYSPFFWLKNSFHNSNGEHFQYLQCIMDIYSFFEEYASAFFLGFCKRNLPLAYSLIDHIFQVTTNMDQLMRGQRSERKLLLLHFILEKRKEKKSSRQIWSRTKCSSSQIEKNNNNKLEGLFETQKFSRNLAIKTQKNSKLIQKFWQ